MTVRMAELHGIRVGAVDDRGRAVLGRFDVTDPAFVEIRQTPLEGTSSGEFHEQRFVDINQRGSPDAA